jgi:hypothetical protein
VEVTSFGPVGFGPADFGAAGPGPAGFAPGGMGEGDPDGAELPRRVRQANLAPQLRESPAEPSLAPVAEILAPTPEEARSTMTAIQHGWERGRSVFDDLTGDTEPGVANGGSAASLDPAGDGETTGLQAGEAPSDSGGTSE